MLGRYERHSAGCTAAAVSEAAEPAGLSTRAIYRAIECGELRAGAAVLEGGRNRSKVLGRKRDAESFDGELTRRRRTGEIAHLDRQGDARAVRRGLVAPVRRAEPRRDDAAVYAAMWAAYVLAQLGALALRELTPTVVNRFRLELDAAGVGRGAIAKTLTLLQGVLQRACQ